MDKTRILVAEDEGIIAKDLENTLKGMGYAVSGTASSGEEAIRKALETRPDLVLMDIVLRGDMDGVAAAEEIRAQLGIPVIFLTAYADEKALQRAKISGPFGYMLKPFQERELRGAIEVALHRHEMEKKVKKSAEDWRSTFDSIQDWISIHDCNFRIVRVNRAMADAFRRDPQDMIGKTCYQVFHRSNEPIPQCPHRRALETRRPVQEEIFDPGLGIHLEISSLPIFDGKGDLTGTVHIAKDISERKKAEEELRKSEERYRRLFEEVPIGLYRSTPEGKLLDANPALARLLGYPDADSLRRVEMADTYVDPRGRERFKALMEEKGRVEQFRAERRRRDGTRFWCETQSLAVRGPDGAIQCYEGSVQDVSDRQEFEEELGRSENHAWRLAREKSILAEIGRIISSTADIEEVYKSFAGEVKKLLPFDRLIVTLVERGKGTMVNRFIEGTSVPGRNMGDVFPLRGTFGEAVIESRGGILLQVESEEDAVSRFPGLLLDVRAGLKSALSVPLFHRDEAVGVLHIFSETGKAYREEDLPTARSIADQIAGAVINAQLFLERKQAEEVLRRSKEDAQRLAEETALIAELGRIISSTLNIEEVYESFSQKVKGSIPYDRIVINLLDKDGKTLANRYVEGDSAPGRNEGDVFPLAGTLTEEIIRNRQGFMVASSGEDEMVPKFPGLIPEMNAGFRSFLSVPLIARGQPVGGLHFRSRRLQVYSEKNLKLAESIAAQIAGAIVNADLFSDLKRAEEALKDSEKAARRWAQENAMMAEIGQIVSSAPDLRAVYPRFAQTVRQLIPFDRISIIGVCT